MAKNNEDVLPKLCVKDSAARDGEGATLSGQHLTNTKFVDILEKSANPAYLLDEDGLIIYVNAAFEKKTGLKKHQVIGKPLKQIGTS